MDVINNEVDLHQTNDEHKKTSKLLDAENVTWIVETKLDVLAKNSMNDDNGGGVDDMQNNTTEWDGVVSLTKEELSGLTNVEEKREVTVNEMKMLEQTIHQLRAKFLSKHTVSWYCCLFVCGFVVCSVLYINLTWLPLIHIYTLLLFLLVIRTLVRWKLMILRQSGSRITSTITTVTKRKKRVLLEMKTTWM